MGFSLGRKIRLRDSIESSVGEEGVVICWGEQRANCEIEGCGGLRDMGFFYFGWFFGEI